MPITCVVGDGLAVDLGLQELGDEVVARVVAAVVDLLGQERRMLVRGRAAHLGLREADLEQVAHPLDEGVGHVSSGRRAWRR